VAVTVATAEVTAGSVAATSFLRPPVICRLPAD
jgi:hypothetical protein